MKFTHYRIDTGAWQVGNSIVVPPPASDAAAHTIYFYTEDNAGNAEAVKTYAFTVNAVVVSGNATLQFRWSGSGSAELHVENASGAWIAQTSVSGSGSGLSWDVVVPAGQNYYMVCDYYWDDDYESEGGGYGYWTGITAPGQNYPWGY